MLNCEKIKNVLHVRVHVREYKTCVYVRTYVFVVHLFRLKNGPIFQQRFRIGFRDQVVVLSDSLSLSPSLSQYYTVYTNPPPILFTLQKYNTECRSQCRLPLPIEAITSADRGDSDIKRHQWPSVF